MTTGVPFMDEPLRLEQQRLVYRLQFDLSQLTETQRKKFAGHSLISQFSIAILISLHYLTFGVFTVIYFGLKFSKLPVVRNNDLAAGKAIGFSFIPFFNAYWLFRFWFSLVDRINFQFRLMGQRWAISEGLTGATVITGVIPYINLLISYLILFPLLIGQIQNAINKLAMAKQAAPAWEPLSPDQEGSIYSLSFDLSQLSEEQRLGFSKHSFISGFSTAIVIVLHILTFGTFTYIYFALKHSKLPFIKKDDFGWAKAIDFLSIPFLNFYWMFKFWLRLADRINFQFRLRSKGVPISRGLAISALIVNLLSAIVNIAVSIPKMTSSLAYSQDYALPSMEPNLSDVGNLIISQYKEMFHSIPQYIISPNMLYSIPYLVLISIVIWQIQRATNKLTKIYSSGTYKLVKEHCGH